MLSRSEPFGTLRLCLHLRLNKPKLSPLDLAVEFAHHDNAIARLNNGSFGSCPSSILSAQSTYRNLYLWQPDNFYFNRLKPDILRSRSAFKDLINTNHVDEVSIVDNTTTAAAIIFQHVSHSFIEGHFFEGDVVVMLHYAFGTMKNSIEAYITRASGRVIEVSLPFPVMSDEEIMGEFWKALSIGKEKGRKALLKVLLAGFRSSRGCTDVT